MRVRAEQSCHPIPGGGGVQIWGATGDPVPVSFQLQHPLGQKP